MASALIKQIFSKSAYMLIYCFSDHHTIDNMLTAITPATMNAVDAIIMSKLNTLAKLVKKDK